MIVAPIVARSAAELRARLDRFLELSPDCAELRLDARENLADEEHAALVRSVSDELRRAGARLMVTAKGESERAALRLDPAWYDYLDLDAAAALRIASDPKRPREPVLSSGAAVPRGAGCGAEFLRILGPKLILSFHDFFAAQPIGELPPDLDSAARRFPQAILKIARTVSAAEGDRFLNWIGRISAERAVIGVPMGEEAAAFRLLAVNCGSLAEYGYLDRPNAAGQPSAESLIRLRGR